MKPIFKNPFKKLLTVNDLATKSFQLKSRDKSLVKILFIDDNDFEYENEMKDCGFNISCLKDLEKLDFAEAYQIIISDITGVGKKLKYKYEGVGLINALHSQYPYKIFGIYTGNTVSLEITEMLKDVEIINKSFDKDNWESLLEKLVKRYYDPKTWLYRLRGALLDEGVSLYQLAIIEHKYVDAILHKKNNIKTIFDDEKLQIPNELKTIVSNIISNAITSLLL